MPSILPGGQSASTVVPYSAAYSTGRLGISMPSASNAFLSAWEAATLNAISEESTVWYEPSTSVAWRSTTG